MVRGKTMLMKWFSGNVERDKMTVGYLLDLFIINQVKKDKLGHNISKDVKYDLDKQDGHLLKEIGNIKRDGNLMNGEELKDIFRNEKIK